MRPLSRRSRLQALSTEELGPQSTQHVGVDDDIEAAGSKRQPTGGGGHHARPGGESFAGGAVGGHAQPFQGQVGEDDLAAGPGGQVQPGPAPPRSQVEEAVGGRQVKFAGEGVGWVRVVKPLAPQSPPMTRRSISQVVGEGRLP